MDICEELLSKFEGDPEFCDASDALREAKKSFGDSSDEAVIALERLARVLQDREEYLDALTALSSARSRLEERGEPFHPLMSYLLIAYGENYLSQGMLAEAKPYLEKALAIRDALSHEEDTDTAFVHMKIGEIELYEENYPEAEQHFLRAYQILNFVAPDNDVALGDVCHNIGILFYHGDQLDRASAYLSKASNHRLRAFGPKSQERASTLAILARVSKSLGDMDRAVSALECVIEASIEAGAEDSDIAETISEIKALKPDWVSRFNESSTPKQQDSESSVTSIVTSELSAQLLQSVAKAAALASKVGREDVVGELLGIIIRLTGAEDQSPTEVDVALIAEFLESAQKMA